VLRRSRRLRASTCALSLSAALGLVLVTVLLSACGSPGQAASPAAPTVSPVTSSAAASTRTVTFAPFAAAVAPSSAAPITASCWTTSIAAPATNTYRCLAKNEILDPCFAPTVASTTTSPAQTARGVPGVTASTDLTCFADPWSKGVQVMVKGALPKAVGAIDANPWALQLADGVRCVSLTGTVRTIGQLDLTYRCGTSGSAGLLASASPGAARAVEYSASATGTLQRVSVDTLWRG
jgi:hypothetical protein